MQILAAFRSGLNTHEIARKFGMNEPDVVRYLHSEMDFDRIHRSATPRPTPPGSLPTALTPSRADDPGGTF